MYYSTVQFTILFTYSCAYPIAAIALNTGIVYIMNRSSLCGSREYTATNPRVGRRRGRERLSLYRPHGMRKRGRRRERGRAELKYHHIGNVYVYISVEKVKENTKW